HKHDISGTSRVLKISVPNSPSMALQQSCGCSNPAYSQPYRAVIFVPRFLLKKLSFSLLLFALLAITFPAFSQTGLVISQLYGGGGNGSTSAGTLATYTNDFIELYNASSAPINLGGLSVQYASASGTSWNAATLPAVS